MKTETKEEPVTVKIRSVVVTLAEGEARLLLVELSLIQPDLRAYPHLATLRKQLRERIDEYDRQYDYQKHDNSSTQQTDSLGMQPSPNPPGSRDNES